MDTLVLAANPGSASRKYSLYDGDELLASLYFEYENGQIVCTAKSDDGSKRLQLNINDLEQTPEYIVKTFEAVGIKIANGFKCIGLRLVAPTTQFLKDCLLDDAVINKLAELEHLVPLHIRASLEEARGLKASFAGTPIIAVSDSAFHITKPDYAWNYAIPLEDADQLEIKRFGYHGISLASIVRELKALDKLPEKLIVCHLGSGNSVTAVLKGQSLDTTMGYSPLEGLMMATRSGSIDITAALALQKELRLSASELEDYLNKASGLLGVSGMSSDIRELLQAEANNHYRAGLALRMYVYRIQQAIGQMVAGLEGVDALVFTAAVGSRSFIIRQRVVEGLAYLGFSVDEPKNSNVVEPSSMQNISLDPQQKPIYVITTDEAKEIAIRALAVVKNTGVQ
jgi:acetate kinase